MPLNSQSSKAKKPASVTSKTSAKAKPSSKKTSVKKSASSLAKERMPASSKKKALAVTSGLKVGDCAPDFSLPNEQVKVVTLSEIEEKRSSCSYIPRIIRQAVLKKPVRFVMAYRLFERRGLWSSG